MGFSSYSTIRRNTNAERNEYATRPLHETFTQQASQKAHPGMSPVGVAFRESRDSDVHPLTIPVQLYLDVTGSMGKIPHMMIKDGLPKMISVLLDKGINDVSLMFGAIGDHTCDIYPLQVAQFESGDEELDMWLTRTYIEHGGGRGYHESYQLAWYFAANHVVTDAWEKRKQKGFVFTIGDECFYASTPISAINAIMGVDLSSQGGSVESTELLRLAQEKNHVYHIFLNNRLDYGTDKWQELLGQNVMFTKDYTEVPKMIAETILCVLKADGYTSATTTAPTPTTSETEMML